MLSAYGMGLADQTAMREKTVERALDAAMLAQMEQEFDALAAQACASLESQGVAADRIEQLRSRRPTGGASPS